MKDKFVRANNAPFMSKILSKAIMTRSRLKNKFHKNPDNDNKVKYKKQRNYCVNLVKKEKKKYYDKLNINNITSNKTFWNTMKPFFSDKCKSNNKITLIEGDTIISDCGRSYE